MNEQEFKKIKIGDKVIGKHSMGLFKINAYDAIDGMQSKCVTLSYIGKNAVKNKWIMSKKDFKRDYKVMVNTKNGS